MIQEIEISKLKIHPKNVRKNYNGIDELADSIKAKGILQNLTVVPDPDEEGTYLVVIGNRRLTAARKAGIKTAPCFVTEMSEKDQASTMLMENMQRDDLTIYEQAQGFQMVLDLGETEDGLAEKTGFSKTTIRRRLNIAKLDQEALQEKESEDGFQLSLSDLYELEKIKSVAKKIIAMLKKSGIEKAPEKASTEIYSNKWETVKSFSLRDEPPKKINIKPEGTETLYYIKYWSEIKVIRKAKKVKRELTPEEKRRAERDSRKKKIKAMAKEMAACRREFILDIISGKVKPLKDGDDALRRLLKVIRKSGASLYNNYFLTFLIGKSVYEASDEEKQDAEKKLEMLDASEQILVAAYIGTEGLEFTEWTADFKKSTGEIMKEFYEVLIMYGFVFGSDDEAKLINGTHELYTETEIK